MNKFLMLVVLVLLVLASAVGLRNLTANQQVASAVVNTQQAPTLVASNGLPMPPSPW